MSEKNRQLFITSVVVTIVVLTLLFHMVRTPTPIPMVFAQTVSTQTKTPPRQPTTATTPTPAIEFLPVVIGAITATPLPIYNVTIMTVFANQHLLLSSSHSDTDTNPYPNADVAATSHSNAAPGAIAHSRPSIITGTALILCNDGWAPQSGSTIALRDSTGVIITTTLSTEGGSYFSPTCGRST